MNETCFWYADCLSLVEAVKAPFPQKREDFMKITILATALLCIVCVPAVFAQNAPVLSNLPAPIQMQDHPLHASQKPMALQQNLLGSDSTYFYEQGEVPLAELGSPIYQTPLGDLARAIRLEHASDPKAVRIFEQ